ncbi:hypothetical protein ACWOE3_09725 [Enterococcus dispar]|uniref:hypothetical protein n=1 Tax=Enterococcus dispar TaxID=44009 RepID=UPI00039E1D5A|nr:hypothetical protein [Enterococcus dispar]MCU7356166.1 hypothetical protein [Enterococcus dispar]MDT2704741.1 hypothetical protein [Enterococcus dispar]OJG37975.1 hypothetical protein RV01_GL000684 [Enterococcus dispar]WCG33513.1 hypothetical protein PML78_02165 [Enterococcus dispar]
MDWNEGIEEFCLDIAMRGFSKITIKNYRSKLIIWQATLLAHQNVVIRKKLKEAVTNFCHSLF